jgi:hypothetical protein
MPALDNTVNFGRVTVLAGHNASDVSIALQSGNGALLPVAPFNVVYWNSTDYADPSSDPNKEIVRVTAGGGGGGGDTLTVIRGQEGTAGSTKNTAGKTYQMVACPTSKVFNTDLYNCFSPDAFFGRMPNPTFPKAYVNSTINGNNDVYTVPANRVALVHSLVVANFGVNNPNYFPQFKSGGTYYQWAATAAVGATPSAAAVINIITVLLTAGEILSLHADAIGMSAWFTVFEFDAATTNITRGFITSLANGNNTLYTVPAGKTSRVMPRIGGASAAGNLGGIVIIFNISGGPRTYVLYAVPSGGSTGVTNELSSSAGVASGSALNGVVPNNLSAGDFVVVNTDAGTATQTAMIVMIEN